MSRPIDINPPKMPNLPNAADATVSAVAAGAPGGVSLYIHVPFCASKCVYCDFLSAAVDTDDPACATRFDAFCEAVTSAVGAYSAAGLLGDVPTIYIGGGTPTLLGDRLPALVRMLRALPGVSADAEITSEANPDSLDAELVSALVEAGLTRVSLGVQSLDDDVLSWLGRRHSASRALAAAALLRDSDLRFSVDIMCGVPQQSAASWEWTVADAISTGAGHVSVYPLAVEDYTPLSARVEREEVPDTDPDVAAEQMALASGALWAAGFERYEIASYARPGEECAHNVRYWTGASYLGIGPAAASMLPAAAARALGMPVADGAARVRFTMHADAAGFIAQPVTTTPAELETLTAGETLREDAMLGLRLSTGISVDFAEAAGVTAVLGELAVVGLVERVAEDAAAGTDARWRTTERGWLLGNEVFGRVWAGE